MARDAADRYCGLAARPCDSCNSSPAVLFCRPDAAYLCGPCDARVHAANRLASRHERVWMCEVCEQAPAAVTCKADAATLCVTCDADIHAANPLARRHERFPVAPFYEPLSSAVRPSAAAAAFGDGTKPEAAPWSILNTGSGPGPGPNPSTKGMMETPDLNFFADVDPYLDLDYAECLVPVQGKPAPRAGGIAEAARAPTFVAPDGVVEIDFTLGKPSYGCYNAHSLTHSVSSSDVGVVPDGGSGGGGAMTDVSNPYCRAASNPMAAMDREARVMRYREKRKNRKFEKTIRYASRKAYAETRPRIKGRFAKRMETDPDPDRIYPSAAATMMADAAGYGVVPSF